MNKLQLSLAALAVALASTSAAHAEISETVTSTSDTTGGATLAGYSTHTDTYNVAKIYIAPVITNITKSNDLTQTFNQNTVIADATARLTTGHYALSSASLAGANSSGLDVSFSLDGNFVAQAPKYLDVKTAGDTVHIVTTASGQLNAGVTTVTYTLTQFAA